ncbi:ABC transporter permease [Hanamia caeni]|jgi:putative ABC transport system permease protein|uniref:ABC transporter permease n=1 Tax=Hanamia caeni TaxID=2294116 RepID=A0A3M9N911_9BACT|nr:ABC transporter permease [Hanamia caeni]
MFKNYFKIAWRNLQRNKVYSFINIAGLSLGLAAAMLIILYVKDEVSYDRFQKNIANIYRITFTMFNKDGGIEHRDGITGYFQGPRFTANVSGIQSFVRIQSGGIDIKKGTDINSEDMLKADSSFFSVFSFPLLSGNPKTCLSNPYSIVVSEDEAKKQFGTTDAVGKTILVKNDSTFVPYTVTAVAKRCPQNSSVKFNILLPLRPSADDMQSQENWFNFFLNTFVVLDPHANVATVKKQMQQFYDRDSKEALKMITEKYGAVFGKAEYGLQPMAAMHLSKDFPPNTGLADASNPVYSYILSGIALFILLIACINFVNLTVARSLKRAKEIGIRKVVGGNRKQLMIQFLSESFILCFIAFVMALGIVKVVLPVFNDLSNKALALSYLFDARLIAFYIVLFIVTSLLAGFYPAIILSGFNPVQTLYSRFTLSGKNYLQKSLVVLQFALASFLICATIIIYLQFNFLTTEKLGYDDSNLVLVNKDLKRDEAKLFTEQLMKDPDIIGVAPKNGGYWGTRAKVNGDSTIDFAYETIDETYLPLLKIPLVAGRNFSRDFPSDSSNSVLVNEAFVKQAGWKNPLGQEVNFWYKNKKYNVIGVVKDYHFEALSKKIGPQLFTMDPGNSFGMANIKIRPKTAGSSLAYIQKTFKNLFPLSPYSYTFKQDENSKNYEAEAKWKQIMLFSAILTIFISCIGLFGLSVLSAEKRTKEIGIRKVLGASVSNIITTLSSDFLILVLVSMLVAIPAAWIAAAKWLEHYPYRISLSWWMFSSAAILVIFIALATVSFQAIKAAIANPVASLRTE